MYCFNHKTYNGFLVWKLKFQQKKLMFKMSLYINVVIDKKTKFQNYTSYEMFLVKFYAKTRLL